MYVSDKQNKNHYQMASKSWERRKNNPQDINIIIMLSKVKT